MMKHLTLVVLLLTSFLSYSNDLCSNATPITPGINCNYTNGTFSGATLSSAAPSCATSASQDVWYSFVATDATMSISLYNTSNMNLGMEIVQATCGGTILTCDNSSTSTSTEFYQNNNFVAGQTYLVRVFHSSATPNAFGFQICVQNYPAPSNDDCSNATSITPGINCNYTSGTFSGSSLTTAAPSCATSSVQDVWYSFVATDPTMSVNLYNTNGYDLGMEIINTTCGGSVVVCDNSSVSSSSEFYLNNNFNVGQTYLVRVFHVYSSLQTAGFQICVQSYPTPSNDLCANATSITPGVNCNYTSGTFSGSSLTTAPPSCSMSSVQDVWYSFVATDPTMSVNLYNTNGYDLGMEIINATCGGSVLVCDNSSVSSSSEFYLNNNFNVGQTYLVRVFHVYSSLQTAGFQICVQNYPAPSNDLCANAISITPGINCNYTSGTFSGSSLTTAPPSCSMSSVQDVWYSFVATDPTMSVNLYNTNGYDLGMEIINTTCGGSVVVCDNSSVSSSSEFYLNNNFNVGQTYLVRVFHVYSSLQTAGFQICVQSYPTPSNDLCANAISITPGVNCNYTSGTFSGSSLTTAPPSCSMSSVQDVWYSFVATDPTMSVNLYNTNGYDLGMEIINATCGGSVVVCDNSSVSSSSEFYLNNNFNVGQTYLVRVFHVYSSLQTAGFQICVQNYPAPSNDLCANATSITPGINCNYTSGTFSGSSLTTAPPSCSMSSVQDVWYSFVATDPTMSVNLYNTNGYDLGMEIINATCGGSVVVCDNSSVSSSSEFYLNNNFNVGQTYLVRVFHVYSSLQTAGFQICVQSYPAPSNDLCANATSITPGINCNYTSGTFSGSSLTTAAPSCSMSSVQDVWYSFVATDPTMSVNLYNTNGYDLGMEIINATCGGSVVVCDNSSVSSSSEFYQNNTFIVGQTYLVRVFHVYSSLQTGGFQICVQSYPTSGNDLCANAFTILPNNTCFYTTGSFSGTGISTTAPSCASSASQDVWYSFVATSSDMSITVANSTANTAFEIIQGTCNGSSVNCTNNNGAGSTEFYQNNNFIPGQTYFIRVLNASSTLSSTTFQLCVQSVVCTPVISISSNTSTTICSGTTVNFTATPTNGGSSPVYQWKLNGANVGTNASTYTNSTLANGDVVSCELTSNASCANPSTATSNSITFTVTTPVTPTIAISANQSIPICAGTSVTFTATITNDGANPSYQWQVNGSNVGPNAATFTSSSLANGDVVTCNLTSSLTCVTTSTVTSNGITMMVNPATPTSVSIASNVGSSICAGTSVTFTATPVNGGTPTYQWQLNGSNVGTNTPTYTNSTLANGDVVTCQMVSSLSCPSPATAVSNTIIMTVNSTSAPTITITSNQGATICAGANVTLTASITNGGVSPTYQWKLNGSNVGANAATYSNSSLVNGDVVTCELTSSATCASPSTATSNSITFTVTTPVTPTIAINANQSMPICAGTSVTFTATITNGGANPSYQWQVNGSNVGPNAATFTSSSLANGDVVTCNLTSSLTCVTASTVTSNGISMMVNPATPTSVSIASNVGSTICAGTSVTFTATPVNGGTPTYQWQLNGSNVGTNTPTYTNSTLANGDVVTCQMVSSLSCPSPATAVSNAIIMTVNSTSAPTIAITSNQGATICSGANVTLTASITNGGAAPVYQWSLNGTPVGANAATYSNNSLVNGDVVTCELTSNATCASITTATSNTITFTVTQPVTPTITISANQSMPVCEDDLVSFTASITNGGANPSYQWKLNGSNVGTNAPSWSSSVVNDGDVVTCILTSNASCVTSGTATSNAISVSETTIDLSTTVSDNVISANQSGASYQWINCTTQTPIPGATQQSYTVTVSGLYAVQITIGTCSGESECELVFENGLDDLSKQPLILFPNPAAEEVFIDLPSEGSALVKMYDVTGRMISDQTLPGDQYPIDVRQLAPGTYQFVVEQGERFYLGRVVVRH